MGKSKFKINFAALHFYYYYYYYENAYHEIKYSSSDFKTKLKF